MPSPRILLIIGGGIAAYKSIELVRLLKKSGTEVRCVLTRGGEQFVTPLTLAALSENPVHTNIFDLKDEVEMGHIQLSRQADLVVVCPATADLLAKMAAGIADDLATTLLLATDKRVLAVPAMNVRMWLHPATQRNVVTLRGDGVMVMEPDEGEMACGEFGPGRLPEPEAVAAKIELLLQNPARPELVEGPFLSLAAFERKDSPSTSSGRAELEDVLGHQPDFAPAAHRPLFGQRILVTAGPTHEAIDPVRYIANKSSGKQGFAIAAAAAQAGAEVTLIAGPVNLPTPAGVIRHDVTSAREMADAVNAALPADAAIMVAAVADWRAGNASLKPRSRRMDRARCRRSRWPKIPTYWPRSPRPNSARACSSALRPRPMMSSPTHRPSSPKRAAIGSSPMMSLPTRWAVRLTGCTSSAPTALTVGTAWPRNALPPS